MDIAILYIGTGKYSIFWNKFYQSSEIYFLPNHKKHYFVFTDDDNIESSHNITKIYKKCEGFPYDSLYRFKIFLTIKSELLKYDYTYFFNSNMLFLSIINDEFLPKDNDLENGLLAVLHPGHFQKHFMWYPYERNKSSMSYIPYNNKRKYHYFMGGVNGGISSRYLQLIETCAFNIDIDKKDGIIAKYHDESHLNKYLLDYNCKILGPEYGWIEDKQSNFSVKILITDKTKIDINFKKQSTNIFIRLRNKISHLYSSIIWLLNLN